MKTGFLKALREVHCPVYSRAQWKPVYNSIVKTKENKKQITLTIR